MKVVLYTKADCGLCVEAEDLLRSLQQSIRFHLEVVHIEDSRRTEELYRERVPVVVSNGREIAAAPLTEERLAECLRAVAQDLPSERSVC